MNLFIDTNILLSFYHLTNDDLEELRKLSALIDTKKINLILPKQVVNEFKRNRENKIEDSLKRLNDVKNNPQYPQICKDYPEYAELRESQNIFSKKHSDLINKLRGDIKDHKLKADVIIEELFRKAKSIDYDETVIAKAKLRVSLGNPPGKNGSIGDAINWETVLEKVDIFEDLYFIADDKDYYSILDTNCPKDYLVTEWEEEKKSTIHFYRRLSSFFKIHFPEIKLASEVEKELLLKEFRDSTSFFQTHSIVEKLNSYSDFTVTQVDDLIRAALLNNQIKWIITDTDVKELLESCISGKEDKLDKNNLKRIQNLLNEKNELEDVTIDIEKLFKTE